MPRRKKKRYKLFKNIRYSLGYPLIHFIHFLVVHIPLRISLAFARILGVLSYYLLWRYRKRALRNIEIAFNTNMKSREQVRIIKALAKNLWKSFVEIIYSTGPHKGKISERIMLEGRENLERALSYRKGVIAVSAHLGNFAILGFGLVRNGYRAHIVIKPVDDRGVENIFQVYRKRQGANFILTKPSDECLKKILKALRSNEIVCLLVDLDKRRSSVMVDFIGKPAATTISPAVISLRTGSPIVPIFIIRDINDCHKIYIEPPLEVEMPSTQDDYILKITEKINKVIQGYIFRYPEQWSWINQRWEVTPALKKRKIEMREIPDRKTGL